MRISAKLSAQFLVDAVKIFAAHFVRQSFFVQLVDATKNRTRLVNRAQIACLVEIFADAVSACQVPCEKNFADPSTALPATFTRKHFRPANFRPCRASSLG